MKIALINNMNNHFWALSQYLRLFGIEAHLFITSKKFKHFLPEADSYANFSDCDWVHYDWIKYSLFDNFYFSWLVLTFLKRNKLRELFSEYELIVSCGESCAFLEKIGIHSDIIIPYGSDLYEVPFWTGNVLAKTIGSFQLRAYKHARVVITNLHHPLYKKSIEKIGIDALNIPIPLFFPPKNCPHFPDAKFSFLTEHDFIVFNHSRQLWYSNPDRLKDFTLFGGNKRNDKVIRAFAQFLKITHFKKPVLVLFDYGPDVPHSKKLIRELGIEANVKWMEKMERKELIQGLKFASLATDQFRENLCGFGGVSIEVMASGVPLLTYTNGAVADPTSFLYNAPLIEVLTEDQILKVFIDYETNPSKYKALGEEAQRWFQENLGMGLAKKYAKLIELLVKDKRLTQKDKEILAIFQKK